MGPEELRPNFEALAREGLNAIPITSSEDFKTAIVALRALGSEKSPKSPSQMVPAAKKAKLGLTSRGTASHFLPSEERIRQAVEGVRDLLDNSHKHVPQEHVTTFREAVRSQIAGKISELETRSAAEDHGVIQLFDAIQVKGKPDLAGLPVQERAAACRRWLQEHAGQLTSVTEINLFDKKLTVVPREIELFSNLQWLSLSNNQIQTLQGVVLPATLQWLYLDNNQIQNLQGVALPATLKLLSLNNNQIQSLQGPPLPATLQELSLNNNQIQSLQGPPLPATLQELSLNNNQIQNLQGPPLPATLQWFFLNNNRISELPDWVFQLPRTCQLSIEQNSFTPENTAQINRRLAANPNSPCIEFSILELLSASAPIQTLEEPLGARVESFSDEALLARSPIRQERQQKHQQLEVGRITAHYSELLRQAGEFDKAEDRQEYLSTHNDLAEVLQSMDPGTREAFVKVLAKGSPPSYLTSLVHSKEEKAKELERQGKSKEAFEERMQIAQIPLPEDHPLANMSEALQQRSEGKPLPRMGAYFQGLDTGSVKMGTIHGSKRFIGEFNPQQFLCFDFNLTHCAREDLDKAIQSIQIDPSLFEQAIGHSIQMRQDRHSAVQRHNNNGVFSFEQHWEKPSLEIGIQNVGTVVVYTDPRFHSFYNRVEIFLDEKSNQGPLGLQNLHTTLSLLGLGTALCPSRPEDEERMKIFILLHAFCPSLSYGMERDPSNYHSSIEELRKKISQTQRLRGLFGEPEASSILKKYLDDYPELFVKEGLYAGRQTYRIVDLGDQVRLHACGLLFGTKDSVCSCLSSGNNNDSEKILRKIISDYVEKLKAGVAMESNREAYACCGEVTDGSSPECDAEVGGFDSVFTRIIPNAYDGEVDIKKSRMPFCADGIRVLLDADVMGQASCYAHPTDSYGARIDTARFKYARRLGLPKFAEEMQRRVKKKDFEGRSFTSPRGALDNEVMIRDLVSTRFVRAILVPRAEMKEIFIEELQKAGLIQDVEGVKCVVLPGEQRAKPIDSFIYVGNVPKKEMWVK